VADHHDFASLANSFAGAIGLLADRLLKILNLDFNRGVGMGHRGFLDGEGQKI
jgi:hypothetical protein